jgi:hypothetical protein
MAPGPAYPSIQSFYKREVPKLAEKAEAAQPHLVGDGFTEEELADALDPLNRRWNPQREYEEMEIGELIPGPRAVTFIGRIVNVSTLFGRNPKQPKAAGWHYVLLKDNTATISVCSSPYSHQSLLTLCTRSNCISRIPNIPSSLDNSSPFGPCSYQMLQRQTQQLSVGLSTMRICSPAASLQIMS